MTGDVVVTGLGLITPAGIGTEEAWSRTCAGEPTAAPQPALAGLDVDFACTVPAFDAESVMSPRRAWRMDRCSQFAVAAATEAIKNARLDPGSWDGARVGVVMGTTAGGTATFEKQHRRLVGGRGVSPAFLPASLVNMVAGEIALEFAATGPNLVTSTACASGAMAVGIARLLLSTDACDIVLAGGTEATVTPLYVSGFASMGALSRRNHDPVTASRPFDVDRDGFVMGEGAGVLVLEQTRHARARGAHVRATVAGFAATDDGYHPTAPDPSGAAIERALRQALADADLASGDVDHVNAHGTSTPYNDRAEAAILRRALGDDVAVTSTKGVTGHLLSAAGAVEMAFCVLALERALIPPTANLENIEPGIELDIVRRSPRQRSMQVAVNNSFGFGGQNTVTVLTAP